MSATGFHRSIEREVSWIAKWAGTGILILSTAAWAAPASRGQASADDSASASGAPTASSSDSSQALPDLSTLPSAGPQPGSASGLPSVPKKKASPAASASTPGEVNLEAQLFKLQSQAVVETALKRKTSLRDIPLTLEWIPEQELEGTGMFTLCDAIQYFPGMECRRGAMRKVAVSARGLGSNFLSNRLLLLTDGRPDTDPWTGQFYADESLPLTNVKQIEVIRGPGSSLYGSNAFSGVINIIRRKPDDLIHPGHQFGVDARFLAGQNSTYRLQTTVAGKAGDLKALVNYYGYRTDGPHLLNNTKLNIVDNQEWAQTQQVYGNVDWKGVSLDATYTVMDEGRPGGEAISQVGNCGRCHYTPNDSEHVQNFAANLQANEKVSDWLTLYGQAYSTFKRRIVDTENEVTKELQPTLGKRRRLGAEVRAVLDLGPLTATVGGTAIGDLVNNKNLLPQFSIADTREQIFGAFVDAEYRPLDNLILGAGARVDYYEMPSTIWKNKSTQISPRFSIVYHPVKQLTLRTDYGRAFRAPSFAELAIDQQMYASTLLGNPYLKAETLDTVEAAVDYWPAGGAIRITGTGFYNYAHNFINQVFQFGSTSEFENIGGARVAGFEGEIAAQLEKINSSIDLAYQYLDAKAIAPDGGVSQLDFAPHHRVYLRGRTRLSDHLFAEFYGVYVGPRLDPSIGVDASGKPTGRIRLPGYFSANMRVGAHIGRSVTASLVATNVFDSSYEEMHGFPVAPFNVFAEVKYVY